MTDKERYYWDLNGHLVVRNVLTAKELTPQQRAVMFGPGTPGRTVEYGLVVDATGTVSVASPQRGRERSLATCFPRHNTRG